MDEMMIFPITDIDDGDYGQNGYSDSKMLSSSDDDDEEPQKPSYMSLRQRRYSQLGFGNGPLLKLNIQQFNQNKRFVPCESVPSAEETYSPGKQKWLGALRKIRSLKDPWEQFNLTKLPAERVLRHRYNAIRKQWKQDEVYVKMEQSPFNHGAMRSCFRLKKTATFGRAKNDWKHALNYVAKLYMEDVPRDVYFEDVHLQMDAKLWGEEYNRHNPPKKVDIFQMYVLEFVDRPGKPLYHLEHFIEGNYIKYNSNSGFVEENLRFTPQAFSHFTFERSGHKLIVVDIQGVGDLWTDPQIHTVDENCYGDGNLGTRGIALFFHSHVCNSICESLNLARFDLSPDEEKNQKKFIQEQCMVKGVQATRVRGSEEIVVSASPADRVDLTAFLGRHRSHTISSCSSAISEESDVYNHQHEDESMTPSTPGSDMDICSYNRRVRYLSESESDGASATLTDEEDRLMFMQTTARGARPSCVAHEINLRNLQTYFQQQDSILGQIHHELAKYYEIGRFSGTQEDTDIESAVYHEKLAADLGIKEAMLTMARLYLDLPHDVLINATVQRSDDGIEQGVDYMIMAADVGDRGAMIYMAEAYQSGDGLGYDRSKSYKEAVRWYKLAINTTQQDESGEFDATNDNPLYTLQAKVAELFMTGGFSLDKDYTEAAEYYNEAAENAMAAMKGRLANKYYAMAEEAYAMVEEE